MWAIFLLIGMIVLFLIAAVFLFVGKGSWMIAGYNTSTQEEKDKYDEKKLCRGMGVLLFVISLALSVMTYFTYQVHIGKQDENSLVPVAYGFVVVLIVSIVVSMIYSNVFCKKKS